MPKKSIKTRLMDYALAHALAVQEKREFYKAFMAHMRETAAQYVNDHPELLREGWMNIDGVSDEMRKENAISTVLSKTSKGQEFSWIASEALDTLFKARESMKAANIKLGNIRAGLLTTGRMLLRKAGK